MSGHLVFVATDKGILSLNTFKFSIFTKMSKYVWFAETYIAKMLLQLLSLV